MMKADSKLESDLEIINESVRSVSTKLRHFSRKRKCFIYGSEVRNEISNARKIIQKKPEYLIESEINYLSYFVKAFEDSHIHDSYRLKLFHFLEIYKKGLFAIENRIDNERNRIVEIKESIDKESKIQLTFELVYNNFMLVKKKIMKLQEEDIMDINRIKSFIRGIGQVVNHLTQCYVFEFDYIFSEDFSVEELDEFIEELNEFNSSIQDENDFIDFFENFVN